MGALQKKPPSVPRATAFTLVELIVVIGILTLLLGLLMPMLSRVRESAKVTACASNLRQIATLMRIYSQSNDGRLPYQMVNYDDWSIALAPMSRGQACFRCPADETQRRLTVGYEAIRSYGVNNGPFPKLLAAAYRAPWPTQRDALPARLEQVSNHVFLVGDNHGQFVDSAAFVGVAEAEALDGIAWGTHRIKQRRGDNFAFADAHVEYRLKEELDALTDLAADPAGGVRDPWKWR